MKCRKTQDRLDTLFPLTLKVCSLAWVDLKAFDEHSEFRRVSSTAIATHDHGGFTVNT